jgi:hypothetical protein
MEEDYEGVGEEDLFSQVEYDDLPIAPEKVFSMWTYILMFFGPCCTTLAVLITQTNLDPLYAGLIGLAVMNGSINMVIAWLTIRLDDHSNEALVHLETIMAEMDKLEDTLDDANDMVTSFTKDLDEAKELFKKVGVDLTELELEPISDVVQSLKDNKDDLNEILLNLREVDVSSYISEAKAIDWKALLAGINDVMAFIKSKSPTGANPSKKIGSIAIINPSFDDLPADEDVEEDYQDELDEFRLIPMPDVTNAPLSLKRKTPPLGLKRR